MTFSINKINMAYWHVVKDLKDPLYTEDDVILKLIPYLNGSKDIRPFSIRLRCKAQAKYLLDKEVLDIYSQDKETEKQSKLSQLLTFKKSPKNNVTGSKMMNKSQLKDGTIKSAINLPKSVIPIPKEFKDMASSDILQEELMKQYQTTSSHLKDLMVIHYSMVK